MPSTFNQDKELAEFFTDVEHLRHWFESAIAAPELAKRLLVIHGVGGAGKSSLLRMFRLHCKSVNVPVALASGDEAKSALDVLARWTEDLKADGVAFPAFGKTYEHYRAIQAKVDTQAKKAAGERAVDIAGKAASKTAEVVGGALAGAAIGSVIPGIGTAIGGALGGVLGGMGAEALVDWLRGFLTKPDIDLLLDPAKKLTDDFLSDISNAANNRRIVLMLDTFEQMTALDDWARDVAQRVGQISNLPLLVIAGRALPNWNRAWSGWMATAQVEELKPMGEDVMRELIQRYYATMRGGQPNPAQVDAIIRFARGLPMVVTSGVQLWVEYGVENFEVVKTEVVADLVDRLMEGVSDNLRVWLKTAATLRWFNQSLLCAVAGTEISEKDYKEVRLFPFIRPRVEGLVLHDAVREIIDDYLKVHTPDYHCDLHKRAATYFEKRLEKTTGEEAERLGLERLYHRVRADEEGGIKLFQEMAEELTRYRLVNRLRVLLNDANTYLLERENSRLWREYYGARMAHLETRLEYAEKVYQSIGKNEQSESKLRGYASCDLGELCVRNERLGLLGGWEKTLGILETSLKLVPEMDSKMVLALVHLNGAYAFKCEWDKGMILLEQAQNWFSKNGDKYGVIYTLHSLKALYGLVGNWKEALVVRAHGLQELALLPDNPFLKLKLIGPATWVLSWSGRYKEAEQESVEALALARRINTVDSIASSSKHLAYALGMQENFERASAHLTQAEEIYAKLGKEFMGAIGGVAGFYGAILVRQGKFKQAEEQLTRALNIKREVQDNMGIPELLIWLASLCDIGGDWIRAELYYHQCLTYRWTGRRYFESAALTGLVRVKHTQGDYAAIPPLLAEAEQLAQQYEYNDHLASLRLTQGMLAMTTDLIGLNGQTPAASQSSVQSNPSVVIGFFKQAMIYALRYNRFLLDEVLSGRPAPRGTPLRPIIPYCLERGQEGKQMLMALRDWWKTGVNDIGTPRPDTISPIPEGIALLEAERRARAREPGDGSQQKSVVEQIESALAK